MISDLRKAASVNSAGTSDVDILVILTNVREIKNSF